MDITLSELKIIAEEKGFNIQIIEKDYLITYLLYLLKDIEHIYFKGGTALNKIFLNHARLSEDLDFSLTTSVALIEQMIKEKLEDTFFSKITHDKRVDKFVRLIVHYKLFHDEGTIFIDLNERAQLLLLPEKHVIHHFYPDHIPSFSVNTLNNKEIFAEKMAAAMGRNKPRDHFDVYQIIKHEFPLNLELVKKKCEASGYEFSIIKMFNHAKKLKNRWDQDMLQLLAEEVTFPVVMTTLAQHFKLKEEKEKRKEVQKKGK